MIRIKSWQGSITYASPYFIPSGGMTEQTNMVCLLPGQISCREGMEEVANTSSGDIALETWGYTVGDQTDKIFALTNTGNIEILEAPEI